MCGILGKINRRSLTDPLDNADLARLRHRGPDDQGLYNDDHASLGHCRLSIIDLSAAGHQPMKSADGRYVITYNGEIYNYPEIREKLKSEGVFFQSRTDTEIVLQSYMKWGAACLQQFRGMFAFAIWDSHNKTLFMARDRCGEKPFIYFMDDQNFFFASEFKSLVPLLPEMPRLNPAIADMYLHYQYAPEPHTLLENVHKLPAARYAILDVKNWTLQAIEYWDLFSIKPDPSLTKQDIKQEFEQAVIMTLRSDVPVGVALSAGLDSAGIAAIASRYYEGPMQAFCVGYPGRPAYDERNEAQELAKQFGCVFNDVELPTEQFVKNFPAFALLLDEPIADIAAFGHYAIPKACADKNIKVLLTGIGGDEVFWGYDWTCAAVSANEHRFAFGILAAILNPFMKIDALYKFLFSLSRTRKIPGALREFSRKLLAAIDNDAPKDQMIFMAASGAPEFTKRGRIGKDWYGPAMQSLPKNNAYIPTELSQKQDAPTSILDLLFKTWLTSNCLSLGDRVSMAVGVETRLPLLDVRLIEKTIAWRKANPDHTHGQKAMLREILADILPPATVQRRKSGFVPPVAQWINGIIKEHGHCLEKGELEEQGILKSGARPKNQHALYRLILLELWYSALKKSYRVL